MPDRETYRGMVDKVAVDNRIVHFHEIHTLLHQGRFNDAIMWAKDAGLLKQPHEITNFGGYGLTTEQKQLILDTLYDHIPTEIGLPDHELTT